MLSKIVKKFYYFTFRGEGPMILGLSAWQSLVGWAGIEPATIGLKGRCSTD